MAALKGFKGGANNFFKALPFIFKNKLGWIFLIPLALNIILYLTGFSITDSLGDWLSLKINGWLNVSKDSATMETVSGILAWITKLLMQVAFFIIFAFFSGYLILILLSPLFAWLSEKTDNIIYGHDYPFEFKQFIKDIWRGILIALRNLFYETGVTILLILATFIPLIGQIISPFSIIFYFLISSYFYGFSFMDYTCERKRLKVKDSIVIIRKNRGMAIAIGTLFSLSLMIPFCGVVLAGFTAIISSVGATLAMNEIPELKGIKITSQKKLNAN